MTSCPASKLHWNSIGHIARFSCLVRKARRLIAYVRHRDKAHLIADWHEVLDLDSPFHTPAQFQRRLTRFIDQWGKRLPQYPWIIT